MVDQSENWEQESLRYVEQHLQNEFWIPNQNLLDLINLKENSKILDVGCGSGQLISFLTQRYRAQGVGCEPGSESVELLNNTYQNQEKLRFITATAHSLPFESDKFDLVIASSILHWVDRNRYLQSLGELVRVSKNWLLVMDFYTPHPYKVLYSHDKRFYTFKSNVVPPLMASGLLKIVENNFFIHESGVERQISEADFSLGGIYSYEGRQVSLFKKEDTLPLKTEADFSQKL